MQNFIVLKAQNAKYIYMEFDNQRGLAKIILPADVCNALVTSTEMVRLK